MKNASDTIGNRTRDLPDCGAVPQSTAQPWARQINCPVQKLTASDITFTIYWVLMKIRVVCPVTPFRPEVTDVSGQAILDKRGLGH